jgi:ATP-binding cassette subfamily F protein 3
MRAQQMELQQTAFSKQQDKIAHLQKFIDRFKAKASKAKQAQSRVKALERMEKIAPLLAEADFTFEFKEPGNLPNPMLSISDASFGYEIEDAAPKTILRGVSRSVLAGQRIGILGANGQGKSTLVKTIAREMGALAGEVTEGKGLNIGYFAQQELDVLRPQDNPLEHMVRMARELGSNAKEATASRTCATSWAASTFSGDMVKQAVGTMSGGEKARLVLAMIVWQRPNLLLLDEPTNHLDLATREALAVALNEFEGTVMLVSHDRALLRSVCDEFWLVGRGVIDGPRRRPAGRLPALPAATKAKRRCAKNPQQRKQDAQDSSAKSPRSTSAWPPPAPSAPRSRHGWPSRCRRPRLPTPASG